MVTERHRKDLVANFAVIIERFSPTKNPSLVVIMRGNFRAASSQ